MAAWWPAPGSPCCPGHRVWSLPAPSCQQRGASSSSSTGRGVCGTTHSSARSASTGGCGTSSSSGRHTQTGALHAVLVPCHAMPCSAMPSLLSTLPHMRTCWSPIGLLRMLLPLSHRHLAAWPQASVPAAQPVKGSRLLPPAAKTAAQRRLCRSSALCGAAVQRARPARARLDWQLHVPAVRAATAQRCRHRWALHEAALTAQMTRTHPAWQTALCAHAPAARTAAVRRRCPSSAPCSAAALTAQTMTAHQAWQTALCMPAAPAAGVAAQRRCRWPCLLAVAATARTMRARQGCAAAARRLCIAPRRTALDVRRTAAATATRARRRWSTQTATAWQAALVACARRGRGRRRRCVRVLPPRT